MAWLHFSISRPAIRYNLRDQFHRGWSMKYDLVHQGNEALALPNKGGDLLKLPGTLFVRAPSGRPDHRTELGRLHHIPAREARQSTPTVKQDRGERYSAELDVSAEEMRDLIEAEQRGSGPRTVALRIDGLTYGYAADGSEMRWDNAEPFLPIENAYFNFIWRPAEDRGSHLGPKVSSLLNRGRAGLGRLRLLGTGGGAALILLLLIAAISALQ